MSAISLGQPGMIEQAPSRSWSKERGAATVRNWHGPKSAVPALEAQLRAAGYEYEIRYENGPNAQVSARVGKDDDGSAEVPINTWERQVNRVEKSIYEHPSVAALGATKIQILKAAMESHSGSEVDPTGDMATAYNLLLKGVDTFIVEQPVVRLTETVSANFAINFSRANVGKILTYAQMGTLESAPATVLDNKTVPSGISDFAIYGYRKGDPTITQQANGKWQVVTEWEAGFWSTFLYAAAT